MAPRSGKPATLPPGDVSEELARLQEENARLRASSAEAFRYIRAKTDELLEVIGTKTLKPDELDDASLVAFDPIGIVAGSFRHILATLRTTNSQLSAAHGEIQAIFDSVGAALLVLDPERRIRAWNQQAAQLLTGDAVNLHGVDCRDAVCHGGTAEEQCIFRKVVASGGEAFSPGVRLGERIFDVIGQPLFDERGEIRRVVLAYQDISAHRQAENALHRALAEAREAQAKIQGILRAAADGLLLTDARGRIVLINSRAEHLFGIGPVQAGELPSYREAAARLEMTEGAVKPKPRISFEEVENVRVIDRSTRRRVRYPELAVLSAVSARPLRAPCVEMKYWCTVSPSRKFDVMGVSMISPEGLAIRPRMPASCRICCLLPRAPLSAMM